VTSGSIPRPVCWLQEHTAKPLSHSKSTSDINRFDVCRPTWRGEQGSCPGWGRGQGCTRQQQRRKRHRGEGGSRQWDQQLWGRLVTTADHGAGLAGEALSPINPTTGPGGMGGGFPFIQGMHHGSRTACDSVANLTTLLQCLHHALRLPGPCSHIE